MNSGIKMIDEFLIITIPRSIKRQWAVLGGTVARGVPYEMIKFVMGEDAKDYNNNMETITKKAKSAGYPFLEQFGIGLQSKYVKQSAGNIALFWNWAKTLQYIAESGKTVYLTWDDRIPQVPFKIIESVLTELYKRQEDFYIWQLRLRSVWQHLKAIGKTAYGENDDIEAERDLFLQTVEHTDTYFQHFLQLGLLGYDETMIMSPRGAQWLLDLMLNMEDRTEHLKSFEFSDTENINENLNEQSRINNDNWLHFGILDEITQAISERKGIYCPKRIGYEFIYEPLKMNTDVHWKAEPEDKHWYSEPTIIINTLTI